MTGRKKLRLLDKLEREYHRAQMALMIERDRIYPPGTKVWTKYSAVPRIVQGHSLYADQVLLDGNTHASWRNIEIIEDAEAADAP